MDVHGSIDPTSVEYPYCGRCGGSKVEGRAAIYYYYIDTAGVAHRNDRAEWDIWMCCFECGAVEQRSASSETAAVPAPVIGGGISKSSRGPH